MKPEGTIDREAVAAIFSVVEDIAGSLPSRSFTSWSKADHTPVTTLDIEVQERIIGAIQERFPHHGLLFEEGERTIAGESSPFTWIIDPIDGTANMVAGKPEYGISVGLMLHNRFIAAIVAFPALGEWYSGTIHDGLCRNRRTYVPPRQNPGGGEIILCSKTFEPLKQTVIDHGFTPGFYYCATYSILKVLKREALAYHTIRANIYDVGPMAFLLELGGGNSYNSRRETLEFCPSLEKIPFYCAANQLEPAAFLFK